jgi:hypothetical protein
MTGGLIQIVNFGNQDIMLNGNPEITFFTTIYRRYTNFGKNYILTSFDNEVGFNKTSTQVILKNGDLLSKIILKIKIPNFNLINFITLIQNELKITEQSNNYLKLVDYVGYVVNFINKIRYYSNIYFSEVYPKTYITYIQDYNTLIQNNFDSDEFNQYFIILDYIFTNNSIINIFNSNIDYFKNASMYTISDSNLIFLYKNYTYNELSFDGFKFTVYQNLKILDNISNQIYSILINNLTTNNIIKGAWIEKLAIYLFDSIEIYIGSNLITKLTDNYINIYGELTYQNKEVYNELIGNITELTEPTVTNNSNIVLYLSLPLWFSQSYGLAFPLISLQYNDLQLKIKTKKLSDIFYLSVEGNKLQKNTHVIERFMEEQENIFTNKLEITTILEYIYLDAIERKKFAQTGHEYLITQQQYETYKNMLDNSSSYEINFFHCCKDLYWFLTQNYNINNLVNKKYLDRYYLSSSVNYSINNINYINYLNLVYNNLYNFDIVNYIINTNNINSEFEKNIIDNNTFKSDLNKLFSFQNILYNPFNNSTLSLNGSTLASFSYRYFNYIQPYNYYNSAISVGLNIYSFSLNPTEIQPSGSCNFSRIPKVSLELNLINNFKDFNDNNYNLNIIGTNYNILRIIGGIAGLAYTY